MAVTTWFYKGFLFRTNLACLEEQLYSAVWLPPPTQATLLLEYNKDTPTLHKLQWSTIPNGIFCPIHTQVLLLSATIGFQPMPYPPHSIAVIRSMPNWSLRGWALLIHHSDLNFSRCMDVDLVFVITSICCVHSDWASLDTTAQLSGVFDATTTAFLVYTAPRKCAGSRALTFSSHEVTYSRKKWLSAPESLIYNTSPLG